MLKIKKGDKIKVIMGKDEGREGEVEKIILDKGRVLVPGVNMYKKHVKGVQGQKGGIYDIPRPIAISKVALVCPNCKKITRVGFKVVSGDKLRICRKCGREVDSKK